jgi:5'-methylthioadenosine phosphorylase
VVGMTLAPEVFLARELEICYAALCTVTNYAEGVGQASDDWSRVFQGLAAHEEERLVKRTLEHLPALLADFAARLPGLARACPCARTMERYRREGRIGDDWHTWLGEP